MYILANPLISKNLMYYSLKLNDKGLFFMSQGFNNEFYPIFITNDVKKIIGLMGLPETILEETMEQNEFFDILIENKFFKTKKFVVDSSEGGCTMLATFSEYLKGKEFDIAYEKISLDDILAYFERETTFIEKYYKRLSILESYSELDISGNYKVKKLDGKLILAMIPDFDKYRLGAVIKHFKASYFEDEIERDYFLLTKEYDEIIKIVSEINEKI